MPDKKKKYKRIYSLQYGYSHNCIYTYKLKYTKILQTYIVKVTEMLKNTQRTIQKTINIVKTCCTELHERQKLKLKKTKSQLTPESWKKQFLKLVLNVEFLLRHLQSIWTVR